MGLEKGIKYHKEKRKPFRGAKAVSRQCRNHGSCDWCKGARLYSNKKRKEKIEYEELQYRKGQDT